MIVVTGASGFVGRATLAAASKAGIRTRAVIRNGGAEPATETVRIASLGPETGWGSILSGAEAVLHLAARVHVMRDRVPDPLAVFRSINVEGTRRLAIAAADMGVPRFIFVSTVKVHGETTGHEPFRGDSPLRPQDPYARSKAEAETLLREIEVRHGLVVTIVRPPLVYGAGVRANFLALVRMIDRGMPLPFGAIRNRRSLLYVENLADLLLLSVGSASAAGRSLVAADGEPLSTPELVRRIAHALGRPPRLVSVPTPLLRLVGRLAGRPAVVDRLLGSLEVDDREAERELGWSRPHTMEDGLRRTAHAYRQDGTV